jgi:hypothetical protein
MNKLLELAREIGKATVLVGFAALAADSMVFNPTRTIYVRAHMRARRYWNTPAEKTQKSHSDALWMHLD